MENFHPILNVSHRLSITEFTHFDNNNEASDLVATSWKSYFSSVWNIFTQLLPLFSTVSWKRNKIFGSTASHHFECHFCRNILRQFRVCKILMCRKKFVYGISGKQATSGFRKKNMLWKKISFRIMKRKLIKMALKIAFPPYKCTYSNMQRQTQWIYVCLFCHLPFVTRA